MLQLAPVAAVLAVFADLPGYDRGDSRTEREICSVFYHSFPGFCDFTCVKDDECLTDRIARPLRVRRIAALAFGAPAMTPQSFSDLVAIGLPNDRVDTALLEVEWVKISQVLHMVASKKQKRNRGHVDLSPASWGI